MNNQQLIFSFSDTNESFGYGNGFSFIKNRKLFNALKIELSTNVDSSVVIKSLDNLKISDVFQLKINIKKIGYFLVNFPLEENADQKYLPLIEEIKTLKDEYEEKDKQLLKIEQVILILNKYQPIYSIFIGKKDTFLYLKECNKTEPNFPLLFPQIEEEVTVKVVEKPIKIKKENRKHLPNVFKKLKFLLEIEKPFFTLDFLFLALFSLFFSFSLYATFAFFYKDDLKGIIFLIQIFFYAFCLGYNLFLLKYKDKRKQHKGENFIIYVYIIVGTDLGDLLSFIFVRYVLKTTGDVPTLILPMILSFVICLSVYPILKLFIDLIRKKKANSGRSND